MANAMKLFGDHLRSLRKARGMSQVELGDLANVNDKYLGEVERGVGNPSLDVLHKLAKALEVDIATLVGDEVAELNAEDLRAEANKHLDTMTPAQLRDLVRMFRLQTK
jgi:transcriptional regulator with XRE-family HTH domain